MDITLYEEEANITYIWYVQYMRILTSGSSQWK